MTPPQIVAAADAIWALLAIIADPDMAKDFLEKLQAALDDGGRAAADLRAQEHAADLASRAVVLDAPERDLASRAAELDERSAALEAAEAKVKARAERIATAMAVAAA
jgi:hypothetical protein